MSNELQMGNSSQYRTQNENLRAKDTVPPNATVILPVYNEEISVGITVLQEQELTNRVIVLDDSLKSCRYNDRLLERSTYFLTSLHGLFENSGLKITN